MSISFVLLVPFAAGFITVFFVERRQPQRAWIWLRFRGYPCWADRWVQWGPCGRASSASSCSPRDRHDLREFRRTHCRPVGAPSENHGHQENVCLTVVALLPLMTNPWLHDALTRRTICAQSRTCASFTLRPQSYGRTLNAWQRLRAQNYLSRGLAKSASQPPSKRHSPTRASVECGMPLSKAAFCSSKTSRPGSPGIGSRSRFTRRLIRFRPPLDEHAYRRTVFRRSARRIRDRAASQPGETRLHLSSQHRVSTDFNWYARF